MRYKRNAIIGELHRAKKTASNFDMETKRIDNKYTAAEFPSRFVHSIIDNFDSGKDNLIILSGCLMKRRLSEFIYHFPQVMKVLRKHVLASRIISPMKNASLMLFGTQGKCSHCFH